MTAMRARMKRELSELHDAALTKSPLLETGKHVDENIYILTSIFPMKEGKHELTKWKT